MTVTSAYIGVLVLAYCTFQPVSSACSDCPCCLTTYKQCMDICEDPNQCTTVCVTNKEKCEEQYCNLTKRNPEGWRLKANGDSVSIPDLHSDIPRGDKEKQPLKYWLDIILAKREKSIKY